MACVAAIIITPCAHKSAGTMKKMFKPIRQKITSCRRLLKTGLNNVVLSTFFNVVNNIEQVVEPESSPQSGLLTMLNNIVDNIEECAWGA